MSGNPAEDVAHGRNGIITLLEARSNSASLVSLTDGSSVLVAKATESSPGEFVARTPQGIECFVALSEIVSIHDGVSGELLWEPLTVLTWEPAPPSKRLQTAMVMSSLAAAPIVLNHFAGWNWFGNYDGAAFAGASLWLLFLVVLAPKSRQLSE